MFKLGITGGMGSGKSTAANFFKHKGATIFDADEESKQYLNTNLSLQNKIMEAYGAHYFKNKQFNLNQLAKIAFANENNQYILNDILWPEIFLLMEIATNNAKKSGCKLFIVDAALLFEAGNLDFFDSILLISALKSIRIKRIINRKNIPIEQIEQRISLQMDDDKKLKMADSHIENNSNIKQFHDDLEFYYRNLTIH